MSLQKIGNLTNAVNTLKKKSGTGKDIISTLSSFGDLSTAAKYLVSTNKKGEKTLSEKTLFNLLKGAYGNLGEEAISEALKQGIKTSSIKGALSSGISGLVSGIGAAGTGLVSFLGSIWPLLAVGGGIFAGVKGYQALNDKFTLTKGMADKHYSQSTQEYADNQSELESLQSQRDSNQERIYELRAKENKSTDEKAELSQLQEENNLLNSQVAIKEKSVDVSKLQAANDAKTKLEKKGYQKNYKKEAYDNQDKTSINDLDEASEMIDYLNQLKSEYKDRVQKIADEGREPSWIEQKGLDSTKKKIDSLESDVADKVTEISDTAKSMKNDDGSLIDKKFKDTVASADAVVQKYLNSTDSTTATSDKMNNIFALSQFSDLKDKLIAAGKSGGTDAIQKMINDTDGLKDAMNNAGLTADDLADSIMSIADPDAKNLEGIKKNLEDIFGKDGLGQSDFFKGKTDEEIENFWDYLQDNNYNPKQMKWDEETTKENFEAAQEAKKKTPEESATFVSKFKNAAEDTATDIDTVTDNFQSDMKSIQSAMESVTNGTFQNSDMADLIQQFPELSNASGDLKDSNLNQQVERRHGSRYEVSPYALLINDGNYYFLAYNDYVKGLRTYRVDRMKDVKLLGIEREGKEVFNKINLKNYTQRVFSMFGGEQERITIQFINSLLDAVVDRFGKKGMLYNVVDDKHFSITAPVEISDQFYGWVLGFGNKAKILKSQKVVDGFTEYLDKIRKTYES